MLWGYRFVNLLNFKHSESEYKIDYSAFNSVYKIEMSSKSQEVKDKADQKLESDAPSPGGTGRRTSPGSCQGSPALRTGGLTPTRNDVRTRSCAETLHIV